MVRACYDSFSVALNPFTRVFIAAASFGGMDNWFISNSSAIFSLKAR